MKLDGGASSTNPAGATYGTGYELAFTDNQPIPIIINYLQLVIAMRNVPPSTSSTVRPTLQTHLDKSESAAMRWISGKLINSIRPTRLILVMLSDPRTA
jgi:hypothetical protein